MKRFHVHLSVPDLPASIQFYSRLFGVDPAVVKDDYAKWMLAWEAFHTLDSIPIFGVDTRLPARSSSGCGGEAAAPESMQAGAAEPVAQPAGARARCCG